jgi:hypothetical protein
MATKMGTYTSNMQTAQASKDATMAYFSVKNFDQGDLLFHLKVLSFQLSARNNGGSIKLTLV